MYSIDYHLILPWIFYFKVPSSSKYFAFLWCDSRRSDISKIFDPVPGLMVCVQHALLNLFDESSCVLNKFISSKYKILNVIIFNFFLILKLFKLNFTWDIWCVDSFCQSIDQLCYVLVTVSILLHQHSNELLLHQETRMQTKSCSSLSAK